jgi:hypothetical protein
MNDDVYRRLARRLDEIPNGFARTESGAELRLLEKLYAPDEAGLACTMSLKPELPEQIAQRVCAARDSSGRRRASPDLHTPSCRS